MKNNYLSYGLRRGMKAEEAEDFASFAIERRLNGRRCHTYQLYVDYIRHIAGDSRCKETRGKLIEYKDKHAKVSPLDEPLMLDLSSLKRRDRIVLFLYYKWGLNMPEIAECFGVSVSRIKQIIDELHEDLRSAYHVKESMH